MRILIYFITLCFANSLFAQEIHNTKNVSQFAIYPSCEDSTDNYSQCFENKLSEDVSQRLTNIKLDKILKGSGDYFAKLFFVIDENGNFTNVTSQGNETLARISTQILYKINREQEESATKIKPALLDGNPVKVSFNIPVKYNLK